MSALRSMAWALAMAGLNSLVTVQVPADSPAVLLTYWGLLASTRAAGSSET